MKAPINRNGFIINQIAHLHIMALKKTEQKRAYLLVTKQLEEAIQSGAFKPGDKLPPEREMKATSFYPNASKIEDVPAPRRQG